MPPIQFISSATLNANIPSTVDSTPRFSSSRQMGSSEIVDSGRLYGGARSNFSQTCNLLSQYLKENGSFGDLTLGFTTPTSDKGIISFLFPLTC